MWAVYECDENMFENFRGAGPISLSPFWLDGVRVGEADRFESRGVKGGFFSKFSDCGLVGGFTVFKPARDALPECGQAQVGHRNSVQKKDFPIIGCGSDGVD